MECRERYFYGDSQEVRLKLPGGMVAQLRRLATEDERVFNNEVTYLLGRKLEGIDSARKRRAKQEAIQCRLAELEKEAAVVWRAISVTQRPRELDSLLPELRDLMVNIQTTRASLISIDSRPEPGEPGN